MAKKRTGEGWGRATRTLSKGKVVDRATLKKPVATPKVTTEVGGGTVTVLMGIKISANYNSESFDVGATLPIKPNESEDKALERTQGVVKAFFSKEYKGTLDDLDGVIRDRRRGRG